MSSKSIAPQNLPEAIVWYYIIGTYGIYLLGANYFLTAFMGKCFAVLSIQKMVGAN